MGKLDKSFDVLKILVGKSSLADLLSKVKLKALSASVSQFPNCIPANKSFENKRLEA